MDINQNNIIMRDIIARAINDELKQKRQAEFVISTEAVDGHGTVFRLDGWDLTRFNRNPIVLYSHDSYSADPNNIIGLGEVFRDGEALIGRVTFEPAEINPKAETVRRKVEAGTLRMASIGARPTKAHWGVEEAGEDPDVLYFDRQELLEFSIVPIGSNPDALKRNSESIANIKDTIIRDMPVVEPETVNNTDCQSELVEDQRSTQDKQLLSIREAQLVINKLKLGQ